MEAHKYTVEVAWSCEGSFESNKYSRKHHWKFDGGVIVPASSAPSVVPVPYSVESAVDPEEAFLASASSCHMLWFLDFARRAGHRVENYSDSAVAEMKLTGTKNQAISKIVLNPVVTMKGENPSEQEFQALHETAHEHCFIANSIKTEIQINPKMIQVV